ncbi:hypothetical protein AUP68_06978 [Ilyonectria robusta]
MDLVRGNHSAVVSGHGGGGWTKGWHRLATARSNQRRGDQHRVWVVIPTLHFWLRACMSQTGWHLVPLPLGACMGHGLGLGQGHWAAMHNSRLADRCARAGAGSPVIGPCARLRLFLGVPSAMRVQTPLGVYTLGLGCCFVMFPMRAFSTAMFPILEVSDVLCVRWAIPTRRHQKVSVAMFITGPRSCRRTKLSSATWT